MSEFVTHFFTGLLLQVRIGIHDSEKAGPQRILIDLEYDLLEPPGGADELEGRLNYDEVRDEVERIALSRHFNLQETLCREIMASLLACGPVARAKVSTRKPDVYKDCAAVGVILEQRKPGTEHTS
ncbi:MAG: dihydroneopterin aldolase [Pseudomonadota bacterium]|nr:dihydroneopterin aldolase [Pseudomonadota bacterium]